MFVQINNEEFVNLTVVSKVLRATSEDSGTSFLFYGANKELIAQSEWDGLFDLTILSGLAKYGLISYQP